MNEKKKGIIFGSIALIAGIIFVGFGVSNLMNQNKKEPPKTENNNIDEPSITVTEDDVKTWLTNNAKFIDYMMNFNNDFDLETATNEDISNVFGWYFVFQYDHGEGEKATDSKYTYRYTMPKTVAEVFLQNNLGVSIDMVDVSLITLSNFKFTSDEENFYAEVATTNLEPVQNSEITKVEIFSDSEIKVTYGITEVDKTCDSEDCYIKTRELILRKSDVGFTIIKASDALGTENNNLEDNQSEEDNQNQAQNDNTNSETDNTDDTKNN